MSGEMSDEIVFPQSSWSLAGEGCRVDMGVGEARRGGMDVVQGGRTREMDSDTDRGPQVRRLQLESEPKTMTASAQSEDRGHVFGMHWEGRARGSQGDLGSQQGRLHVWAVVPGPPV